MLLILDNNLVDFGVISYTAFLNVLLPSLIKSRFHLRQPSKGYIVGERFPYQQTFNSLIKDVLHPLAVRWWGAPGVTPKPPPLLSTPAHLIPLMSEFHGQLRRSTQITSLYPRGGMNAEGGRADGCYPNTR